MGNPNPFILGSTPNNCCCGPSSCCAPVSPVGSQGVIGFPLVTQYVGLQPFCMDGQYTYNMYPGLIVETSIGGYGQSWVVRDLGTGQTTTTDGDGNYIIIRSKDTDQTGLSFVIRN